MNTTAIDTSSMAALASSQTSQTNSTTSSSASGADMFLKLLVEQLKNQDPLAPQDSTQFVTQLAQFNSLEQLISINNRLGQLVPPTP